MTATAKGPPRERPAPRKPHPSTLLARALVSRCTNPKCLTPQAERAKARGAFCRGCGELLEPEWLGARVVYRGSEEWERCVRTGEWCLSTFYVMLEEGRWFIVPGTGRQRPERAADWIAVRADRPPLVRIEGDPAAAGDFAPFFNVESDGAGEATFVGCTPAPPTSFTLTLPTDPTVSVNVPAESPEVAAMRRASEALGRAGWSMVAAYARAFPEMNERIRAAVEDAIAAEAEAEQQRRPWYRRGWDHLVDGLAAIGRFAWEDPVAVGLAVMALVSTAASVVAMILAYKP